MPTKSASRIITREPDWLGPAIPPGEILLEEYLKPLGLGQVQAAERLGISLNRLNEIVLGKCGITADTALAAVATPEDVAATLDAASGRLGSAPGTPARAAEGVVGVSLYLFCTCYSGFEWIWRIEGF
jgi:addiction module HigA family antidote